MNRNTLERDLKKVGVSLAGWLPVLKCDVCKHQWEPFSAAVGSTAPTVRFDYWQCENKCNAESEPTHDLKTALPKYIVLDGIPGMVFGEEDRRDFEQYVRSMDTTQVFNREL